MSGVPSRGLRLKKERDLDHQAIAPTECSLRQRSGWVPRDVKIYKRVSGCLQGFCGLMEKPRIWKITLEVKFQLFFFMWPEIFQKLVNWIIRLLMARYRFWRTHLSHCPFNNNEGLEFSLVVQVVKNHPAVQGTWVLSLGQEDPLEKELATHSSILSWRISWIEESCELQPMGLQRVRHDWATNIYLLR